MGLANGAASPAPLRLVVAQRETVAEDVVAFELRQPDGADLPPFERSEEHTSELQSH